MTERATARVVQQGSAARKTRHQPSPQSAARECLHTCVLCTCWETSHLVGGPQQGQSLDTGHTVSGSRSTHRESRQGAASAAAAATQPRRACHPSLIKRDCHDVTTPTAATVPAPSHLHALLHQRGAPPAASLSISQGRRQAPQHGHCCGRRRQRAAPVWQRRARPHAALRAVGAPVGRARGREPAHDGPVQDQRPAPVRGAVEAQGQAGAQGERVWGEGAGPQSLNPSAPV